ncbi:hypothetical protein COCSUDRAFT_33306 [Coccomyxa subellipsoidea C-169]|uniref:Uncharacterized protein n=1 Tax=Coccomyxa subellipsoidea (strain C-169) TaxID=574566 RepID=I0YY52_COCSC|nr:hypothetical protein COCSUDRAFT_33306 [Coccomyxa subellipsoidea C-169]EIE23321.1 hypothetical protein COCSUDRAFT_33306 [Coccomyxa subellipsoidea C-169]|eukprot:XP_005647865.1 hypothetical protein COCSUDRAFT_33306 [Coccomyxa subellipsoidea C-169]
MLRLSGCELGNIIVGLHYPGGVCGNLTRKPMFERSWISWSVQLSSKAMVGVMKVFCSIYATRMVGRLNFL